MSGDEKSGPKTNESDCIDQEPSLCLFCMGSGKGRDPILLRETQCSHCKGKGFYDEQEQQRH